MTIAGSSPPKVIIVGGGIGGLTAALALLRRGIDVEVYEQSAALKEAGAGVQLGSNGTRVLYALGLEAALARVQVIPAAREIRHWRLRERMDCVHPATFAQPAGSAKVGPAILPERNDSERL